MRVTTNHLPALRPPMSEEDIAALRKRNEDRAKAAIQELGPNWLLWRAEHSVEASQESYQLEQIADHNSRNIPR